MRRVPSGRKGVGRVIRDQPQARHRYVHALGEPAHDRGDTRVDWTIFLRGDRLSSVGRQRDLIGEEVAGEIYGDGKPETEVKSMPPAE